MGAKLEDGVTVISSYHPSQQNTQTGKLTESMFDDVFRKAREILKTTETQRHRESPR
jgi:uracil-DNA glycosylase